MAAWGTQPQPSALNLHVSGSGPAFIRLLTCMRLGGFLPQALGLVGSTRKRVLLLWQVR